MTDDPLERVANLITEVGRCYQSARRYRDLVTVSEERVLDRALDIGADVRTAARRGDIDLATVRAAIVELEALAADCRAAIADVRVSAAYRAAVTAWDREDWMRVSLLAPSIFASVEALEDCARVYYPVPLAAGRPREEHFVSPGESARRIDEWIRHGLEPSDSIPDLGADEQLRAIVCADDPDLAESPVTLAIDVTALPVCRVIPTGETLAYRPRLHAPMRVRFADDVTDEWWAVRPDAYGRYVAELTAELATRGISIEGRAPAS